MTKTARKKNRIRCRRYYRRHHKVRLAHNSIYYYRHKRAEQVRKHRWYIKNRDRVLAKQKSYNRQQRSCVAKF